METFSLYFGLLILRTSSTCFPHLMSLAPDVDGLDDIMSIVFAHVPPRTKVGRSIITRKSHSLKLKASDLLPAGPALSSLDHEQQWLPSESQKLATLSQEQQSHF